VKIKIDTNHKTIELEESVNLKELYETLETFLPNGLWKEFNLTINSTIYWFDPIVIHDPVYLNPYPWIRYQNGSGDEEHIVNTSLLDGVYCIEFNN